MVVVVSVDGDGDVNGSASVPEAGRGPALVFCHHMVRRETAVHVAVAVNDHLNDHDHDHVNAHVGLSERHCP